ncbi:hypothetical protein HYFRA_00002844 [Hymenoscyphus fraxineus]|uniref:Uncharacterized protein n=1 Tax=Hymenoscyphus fraxineus TaxID=746836 RepID=A0A9N9KMQ1_9HELO|nr:hypothetical protein HYFRA_00002844 [Hymenoscyphus fraxineus]
MAPKKVQKRARTPVSPLRKRIPRAAKSAATEKLTNLFKKDSAASKVPAKPAVQTRPISKKRKSESEPESASPPKKVVKNAAANNSTTRLSPIQPASEESGSDSSSESDSDSPDPLNTSGSSQSTRSKKSTSSTRSKESSISESSESESSESESSESTSPESLASDPMTEPPIKTKTNKNPQKSSIKKQIVKYPKNKPKAPTLAPAPKSKHRPPPIKTKNTSPSTKSPRPSKGKTKKKGSSRSLPSPLSSPPEMLPGPLPRSPGPKKKPPLLPGGGLRRQSTETQLRSYQLGTRNPQRGLVDSSLEISPTAPRVQTSRRRKEREELERQRQEEGEASHKKDRKEEISSNSTGSEEFAPSSGEQVIDLTAIRERHDVERARFPNFFESIEEEIGELADELGLDGPVDVELLDGNGKPRTLRDVREDQLERMRDMRKKKLKGKGKK